jgi:hypothetical protein
MRITDHDVAVAEYIIDSSGAVDLLAESLRRSARGRPQNTAAVRQFLIGLLLMAQFRLSATVVGAHRLLTQELPLQSQMRLHVVVADPTAPGGHRCAVTLHDLRYVSKNITRRLAYGPAVREDPERHGIDLPEDEPDTHDHIVDTEIERRRATMQRISDSLMDVFDLGFSSTYAAIDATGIWSWIKGRSTKDPEPGDDNTTDPPGDDLGGLAEAVVAVGKAGQVDPDAAWGQKTSKYGGKEPFFGYEEHTLIRVPGRGQDPDDEPRLIVRSTVTAASTDVVEPSLRIIDSAPTKITSLAADRHYSYKHPTRWRDELHDRGISPVFDLRADDHGFTEHARMRWAAGCACCPATPDELGEIPRPSLGPGRNRQLKEFRERIAHRFNYVAQRIDTPDRSGKHRVKCPALAGKIGCPLRAGTVQAATQLGLPVVENPPDPTDPEGLPPICTQVAVTVTPTDGIRKLMQEHHWGSDKWEAEWNKRTYVEGSYGIRKNSFGGGLRRGMFPFTGLHWVTLVMALVNASHNLRVLRHWHERTQRGDPDHPLLRPAPTTHTIELTPEQAARFLGQGDEAA